MCYPPHMMKRKPTGKKKERETTFPQTLQEAIKYFADPDTCVAFMSLLRWPDGVTCPRCEGKAVSYLSTRRMWKCKNKECHKQFSVKVGTIMEDSPIGLDKWLAAIWMLANCKNGISSWEVSRALDIHLLDAQSFYVHAQDRSGRGLRFGRGLRDLDPAGLAASACVHLRFHSDWCRDRFCRSLGFFR